MLKHHRLLLKIILNRYVLQPCTRKPFTFRNYRRTPHKILEFFQIYCLKAVKQFKIYWIVPNSCDKFNISLVVTDWNIMEHSDDDKLSVIILNNPGYFPTLFDKHTGNGEIPQNGNITAHIKELKFNIQNSIPNKDYDGYAIINMDQWGITWQQNTGKYFIYRKKSLENVSNKYKENVSIDIEEMAANEYNSAAKEFLQETIKEAKLTRPKAKWGFCRTPICNLNTKMKSICSEEIQQYNDNLNGLYKESGTLYPLFSLEKHKSNNNGSIFSCIEECKRINLPCIPLVHYKYINNNDGFLSKEELTNILLRIKRSNLPAVIIWGKENDLTNKEDCEYFETYLSSVLGPVVNSIMTS